MHTSPCPRLPAPTTIPPHPVARDSTKTDSVVHSLTMLDSIIQSIISYDRFL